MAENTTPHEDLEMVSLTAAMAHGNALRARVIELEAHIAAISERISDALMDGDLPHGRPRELLRAALQRARLARVTP